MTRCISERLLCYAIKMARTCLGQSNLWPYFRPKVHCQAVQISAARGELAKREGQTAALGAHGQESPRERACRIDRLVHQGDDLVDARDALGALVLEARREAAQHERDPGELLAEAVVQIAADGLTLTARYV